MAGQNRKAACGAHADSTLINTHVFWLEEFKSAFEVFRRTKETAAKAVLEC